MKSIQRNTARLEFDTASDLRAFIGGTGLKSDEIVYLKGIASVNDGLADLFRWNSTSTTDDDNLDTIKLTAITTGRFERMIDTNINSSSESRIQLNKNRGLRGIADSTAPTSTFPSGIMLEKLRTDYPEFAVYTPMSADGIDWTRWLFTNRLNSGASGATRLLFATTAKLYDGTEAAATASNKVSATQAQGPTVTKGAAAADSRTGTWSGLGTVDGVANVDYSTTIGDKVVYSLTSINRIALSASTNSTNGGYASVVVKDSGGTEIVSGYTLPSVGGYRQINFKDQQNGDGLQYITIASDLTTGDYTVEITVAADNPASGRLLDAGIFGYLDIEYDATGQQGIFSDSTVGSKTYRAAYYCGARVTYAFNGTKIAYRHGVGSNAGKFSARVYDSGGTEIASGKYLITGNEVDAYLSATVTQETTPIAAGLTLGDYYLVIESLPDKNASSSGWRLYDYGTISYDEGTAGVLGTDTFDNLGVATNYQATSNVPAGTMLIGYGNLEQAVYVRRSTDAHVDREFVGGIHGHETAMTDIVVKIDDAVIDFAGGAQFDTWTGVDLTYSFSTELKFPDDVDNFADVDFVLNLSNYGYSAKVTRTNTADAVIYNDYCLMLPVSGSVSTGTWAGKGAGGEFTRFAVDGGGNYSGIGLADDSSYSILGPCAGAVAFNNSYAVYGFNTSNEYRNAYIPDETDLTMDLSLIQDRSDGVAKYYNSAFKFGSNGRTIPSGDVCVRTNIYRCIKGYIGGALV